MVNRIKSFSCVDVCNNRPGIDDMVMTRQFPMLYDTDNLLSIDIIIIFIIVLQSDGVEGFEGDERKEENEESDI